MKLNHRSMFWFVSFMMLVQSLAAQSIDSQDPKSDQELARHGETVRPLIAPVLMKPGKLIFADNFDEVSIRSQWTPLHQTRWNVIDGALHGIPATEDFQKSRTKHNGGTPSSKLVVPIKDGILQMSFKLTGKMAGVHFGFNDGTFQDGTGHVCRIAFHKRDGISLIKDKNTKLANDQVEVLKSNPFKIQSDQWYTFVMEVTGDQMVVQLKDGPTLKARHKRFGAPKSWINLPTRGGGEIYYDDVRIWAPSKD
jgi:hypothetical protein